MNGSNGNNKPDKQVEKKSEPTFTSMIESKFLSHPEDLGVLGVSFNRGQGKKGVDTGPQALVDAGLLTQLRSMGYKLHGDTSIHSFSSILPDPASDQPHRGMKNPRAVSEVCKSLSDQVYSHAKDGRMVLTLGGDHSIAMGTVSGVARGVRERLGRDIAVVWVDAHADLNKPEDSPSGNVHGMPMAFLTGISEEKEADGPFGWLKADYRVSHKKLVYIALRDVDAGEKKTLREHGIKAFSMHEVDRYGIGRVMEMALAHVGSDTPIHMSFDVDALDPMWAPSTGTPVRGGLTLREGDFICEAVHRTGQLVAMDLVEVNPQLAPDEMGRHDTVGAGCSLVRCALGESLL